MKKQLRTSSPFVKHMIFSACLMGMGSAVAQDLGASDTPKIQSMETGSGLPAIRSRGEQRQAQNPPASRPAKRAAAIVQATANWQDAELLARLSENLGEAMVGINEDEIETIMAARGE